MNKEFKLYQTILKKDLINKKIYKKNSHLPNLVSITLHFGSKTQEMKILARSSLIIELITGVKSKIVLSKKQNMSLNTKKGVASGCLVKLTKMKMTNFYMYLTQEVLPKSKKISQDFYKDGEKSITLYVPSSELNCFEEIDFNSNYLKGCGGLEISFLFDRPATEEEQKLILALTNAWQSLSLYNSIGRVQPCQG